MNLRKNQVPWNEVTALFGGRFDPPHLGHREAVRGLFENPGVKQVLILPSACPPHKPASASMEDRTALAEINFKPHPLNAFPSEVRIDTREIDRFRLKPQVPSYSFDTIQELRQTYSQLAFVIGTDQLEQFALWYRFPELLDLCHWIVLERKGEAPAATHRTIQDWQASGLIRQSSDSTWICRKGLTQIRLVSTHAPLISSTKIREALNRTGIPPADFLLPEVYEYLIQKKLYGI